MRARTPSCSIEIACRLCGSFAYVASADALPSVDLQYLASKLAFEAIGEHIACSRHDDVSIMNLLPATVITHAAEDHPALALLP